MLLHSDGEEEGAVGYGADVESEAVVGGMVAGKLVRGGIFHCYCVFGCKDTMIFLGGHLILARLTQRAQRRWGRWGQCKQKTAIQGG